MAKIMVVGNDPDIGEELRKDGHEVVELKAGREWRESIEREKPDLIFLDISMPDGILKDIKKTFPDAGVIVKDGAACYLLRPFDLKNVELAAKTGLENRGLHQELRELEKYRQLIENANDAILIMDYESGSFIEANCKSENLTGYSRAELLKMDIGRIYPRADYERVMAGFHNAIEEGSCLLNNILIQRKDGSVALADISVNVIEHNGKKIIQGIYRDVTERKKLEDELKETKDFMETLIDNLPISLLLFDEGARLIYANEHFYWKSRKTKDIIGKEIRWVFRGLLPRETVNEIESNIKEGIITGLPSEGRLMKHGKFYFSKVCPIKVEGRVKSILLLEDVTEKARLEQEIREYSEHLEQMVEERTRELTESQAKLIQAGKMAGIGTLAGGIAHEVNNPLASILTYAQLLQTMSEKRKRFPHTLTEEKTVEYAKEIEKVVKHCKSTIENLLDFSRASDKIDRPLSLVNVLEDSLSLIRHQLNLQNVKVVKKCEDVKVVGNKNQLQQVFVNLLENSRDAMPKGGRVTINVTQSDGYAKIVFSDTGKGIPPENLNRIFEPFFTTKEAGKGTGLGLYLCYNIIQKLGGTISVESEVGKGTTFIIKLPITLEGGN